MKLTRRLIAAILSVCMTIALLTSASAAEIQATFSPATYYDIAITTYSKMLAFQNGGVVAAADQTKKYGLIDPTGKVILPFQYDELRALAGGLFAARNQVGYEWSNIVIIDAQGKTVRTLDSSQSVSCKNGIIRVAAPNRNGGYPYYNYTYYTPDWKSATAAAYEGTSAGTGGYVDPIPSALQEKYDWVEQAGDCYRVHKWADGPDQVGIVDSKFNVIIPLDTYDYVGTPNADGYISAAKNGSTDLYNKSGAKVKTFADKIVSTEVYFRYLTFSTDGGKTYGMMDVNEAVKMAPKYNVLDSDGNDHILSITYGGENSWNNTYGLYTQDCKQVFQDKYTEISYLAEGKYKLNDGVHFGVSQVSGTSVTPVIPMKYRDMRVHTLQFIELYDGSKYSVVDLSNNAVVPESSERIKVFKDEDIDLDLSIERADSYAASYDGYDKSVLPFLAKTDSGWTTVYADYDTGEAGGQLNGVQASNINDEGWFVYRADDGLFGFGRTEQHDEYIYDVPDPGEEMALPVDRLDRVTDPASAASAVKALTDSMTSEQKQAPTCVDLATLYAENAAAKAASKAVNTNEIVVSAATVADLEQVAAQASQSVENALSSGGITVARDLAAMVTLTTDAASELTIRVEPDVLTTQVDKVRISAPTFSIVLDIAELEEVLTENFVFTAEDVGTGFGPVAPYEGMVTVDLKLPKTATVTVALPTTSGKTTYQTVTTTEGTAAASKYNPATTKIEGKVNTSGKYTVTTNEVDFSDISSKSAEMQKAIRYLASKGIITGTTSSTFSPDGSISRAEIAALLVRALGWNDNSAAPTFKDVFRSNWYYSAAASSQKHGLINGFPDNTFLGGTAISKEQILAVSSRVLVNKMGYKIPANAGAYLTRYKDGVTGWAQGEVALATKENLVVYRVDGTFKGAGSMTRGDAAIVVYRLFQKIW